MVNSMKKMIALILINLLFFFNMCIKMNTQPRTMISPKIAAIRPF